MHIGFFPRNHLTDVSAIAGDAYSTPTGLCEESAMHSHLAPLVGDLFERNWSVDKAFASASQVRTLSTEAQRLWQRGAFHAAGVGRSADRRAEVRSDEVLWLEAGLTPEASGFVTQILEPLRAAINATGYLGLYEFEGHYAFYPPGAFYARHLDQFRDQGERLVSVVLYLNDGWLPEEGGELCLYTPDSLQEPVARIAPQAGTLVCLLSEQIPHEVKPARRGRWSLTGWFRRRPL
jgi:SM-20-related protein